MTRNQVRIEIERTDPFAGGASFGDIGPYEWLQGTVHQAIDPNEPALPYVCDLDLAPRNADGLVEFTSTRSTSSSRWTSAAATGACSTSSPTAADAR